MLADFGQFECYTDEPILNIFLNFNTNDEILDFLVL